MPLANDLIIDNVTMHYKKFKALDNVSLKVNNGEFLTILGPSGSGKTTLLKVIAGFEPLTNGSILLNNEDIVNKRANERNLGILFQNYALFPHMNVYNNVAYPLKLRKVAKDKINKLVNNVLQLVKMEQYIHRFPNELSGGQQQRIALARAIVYEPPILLLDEPLSALDKNLRLEMQLEIKRLQKTLGITTICVTHDQEEAITMSDSICVMNKGKIEQIGSPEKIYKKPKNEFIARFIGEINLIKGRVTNIANNHVEVDIGQQKILTQLDKKKKIKLNEIVNIAIRPENIKVSNKNSQFDNIVPAMINEIIYMGDSFKISTKISTGSELMIKTPNSEPITSDKNIFLGWNSNDTVIIQG